MSFETMARVEIGLVQPEQMPQLCDIETASFPEPWTVAEFLRSLRLRHCIGLAATEGEWVLGFLVFTRHAFHLEIENLAVRPAFRRCRVGCQLVCDLAARSKRMKTPTLAAWVSERSLGAQLFFRALGFQAIDVDRGHYPNGDAGYRMAKNVD